MENYTNTELETFLDDFEQRSEFTFLEDAKQISELFEVAKAKGILVEGSRDLAVFKAVYTFADKPNGNGVTIPEQELLRKLPTVIGKPVTLEHVRRFVIGFVIDYRYLAKEKTAIVYGIIFKNCFKEEWDKAVKLFKDHKLAVSSEIWSPKSKRTYNEDKTYSINDIEFAGCTLVFVDKKNVPAFEDAVVMEIAKKNYDEQEEIIFATLKKENLEILSCGKCKTGKNCGLCESLLTATQEGVAPVVAPAPTQPNKMKIICQHCAHNFEHLFIQGQNNPINCPNCSAILDQAGKTIYPPQIKNFDLSCPECQARNNWLTIASKDNDALVKCKSCQKEYDLKFKTIPEEYNKLLKKIMFLRTGKIPCIQCGTYNNFSVPSSQKKIDIKCKKCDLGFSFDIEDMIKRDIESFAEHKEIVINKEEEKMVILEKAKVKKLLRKAVSKRKDFEKKLKEKVEECENAKIKKEKFVKGFKKFSKKIKDLTKKEKEQMLENSTLKEKIKKYETDLETAKLVVPEPVIEPELETAKATVGDKTKGDDYYEKTRSTVNEKAFGHTKK
jgi:hypothetical protein